VQVGVCLGSGHWDAMHGVGMPRAGVADLASSLPSETLRCGVAVWCGQCFSELCLSRLVAAKDACELGMLDFLVWSTDSR
jgi:hypothetical protein